MSDFSLATQADARIRAHRLPDLTGLDADSVFPHYAGLSIANVAATLGALLGVDLPGMPPLWEPLWSHWAGQVDRVVFLILDALGYVALTDALAADPNLAFRRVIDAGAFAPITSVFPSTTTAATTTFATGHAPAAHGLLGYELFLREFSLTANIISLSARGARRSGELAQRGLDYATFIPTPSVAQQLAPHGVSTYVLLPQHILDSGLSRLQYRGATRMLPYITSSDMWVGLRHLLTARTRERMLVSAYWPGVDSIAHTYGPDTEMATAEIRQLAYSLGRELLDDLAPGARARTLLVISADHGQMRSRPQDAVHLKHHPDLAGRLLFGPTGEARTAYLYARQGEKAALLDYLHTHLADQFAAWDSDHALTAGLFGPGEPSSETRSRIGDITLVARQTYSLHAEGIHRPPEEVPGRHGALSPIEMLVPWLAAPLWEIA